MKSSLLLLLLGLLALLSGDALATRDSLCAEALDRVCPSTLHTTQRDCEACVAGEISELFSCSDFSIEEYCLSKVVKSYPELETSYNQVTDLFNTEVPICGSTKENCWEQTAGQDRVTFLKQIVTSTQFPCKSGESQTTFVVDAAEPIDGSSNACVMDVKGFGGKKVNVGPCTEASSDGLFIGFQCPTPTGELEAVGPKSKCESGYGSYTATLTCPQFEVVTYIKY